MTVYNEPFTVISATTQKQSTVFFSEQKSEDWHEKSKKSDFRKKSEELHVCVSSIADYRDLVQISRQLTLSAIS